MARHGRGHIRKRGKHSYELKWELPRDPVTGKRRQRTKTVRGTKADANSELEKILHSIGAGDYIDPNKVTLAEHLRLWIDGTARHAVSPRTLERYREIVETRWIPTLGDRRISQLSPVDIKTVETDWLNSGRADKTGGLSARTVRHFHWVMASALDDAVRLRLINRNPTRDVKAPKPQRKQVVWLPPEELTTLIDAAKGVREYIPILLAGTAAFRRGEILALKWSSLDFDTASVQIVESLELTKAGGLRVKPPKGGRSRTVALPAMTVAALKEWKIQQKRERLKRGKAYTDNGLVCPNSLGGYWHPRNLTRAIRALVSDLDIQPVTLHGLRHTHITHLLQTGVHPKIAQERAGHSSVSITLDIYSHAVPNMQRDAAEKIDGLLSGAEEC